jgi:MtN3 and saliva related transmembrane protein
MINPEIIGITAGLLSTICFIPQIYKIHKSNKTSDLSLITFIILFIAVFLWFIYGLLIKSKALFYTNILQLIIISYIIYKIIINDYFKILNL